MKVVVAGGTGFIGKKLIERLVEAKYEVVILSRNPEAAKGQMHPSVRIEQWDSESLGPWASHMATADGVFNFAGEPIAAKRWTAKQKERIVNSRLHATSVLVDAMRRSGKRPGVLVNASAVGYYGAVEDGDVTETHPKGNGFLSEVCERWEQKAREAESIGVRVVLLRIGVVLGEDGGALEKMTLPFKLFVGGPMGSGKQWFPWVHRDDIVGAAVFALENPKLSGPVNLAAPEAVTMKGFCAALGSALHRPSWAPVPSLVLRMALGEMSEMLLTGQQQVPTVLKSAGYSFRYPTLASALASIFGKS